MKTRKILAVLVVTLGLMMFQTQVAIAAPLGTAFTYQGHLYDANRVADGLYDFQFKLFDDPYTGSQLGGDVNKPGVDVIDARFTVELDFGGVFDGNRRWLEIGVRPGDQSDPCAYSILSPRQEVTPTPYALYAKTAGSDGDWMVSGNDVYSIPSGNVGIGTTNPEKKLDIASESYTDLGICLRSKLIGGTSWDIDGGGVFKIVEHATCGPEFLNNTRIAVVGNCIGSPYGGNVGIGTTSPAEVLDVNGAVKLNNTANTNAGTIRWTGTDFEGYDGIEWISLTSGGTGMGGNIVQVVNYQTGEVATGTTTIPRDDTIPQNNEGDEYMTLAITPTSATNKLKIEVVFYGAHDNGGGGNFIVALFVDTTANALAAVGDQGDAHEAVVPLIYYMDAGTTDMRTFKVRAGGFAGTLTFNGIDGGRLYGGVAASSITITEIASN